jgi:small nuclear ribonucleoprotein (snRNP)-like protein
MVRCRALTASCGSQTAPRALLTRPQLPLGLLTAATGHPMLVELKSGETLNGLLVNCDTWMNLTLREVVQTSADGDKFMRLPEIYVRGSTVSTHCKPGAYGRKLTMRRSSTCGCRMRSSRWSRSSRLRTRRKEADVAVCTRGEITGETGAAGARAVVGGAVEGAAVVTTTLERVTRGGFVTQDKRCSGMNKRGGGLAGVRHSVEMP